MVPRSRAQGEREFWLAAALSLALCVGGFPISRQRLLAPAANLPPAHLFISPQNRCPTFDGTRPMLPVR